MLFSKSLSLLAAAGSALAEISDVQYDKLYEVANYAKVAYCMGNSDFLTGSLASECSSNSFCTANSNVEVIADIRPDFSKLEFSGTAFIARDNSTKTIYLSFRGSKSVADWVTDFTFNTCPYAPYLTSNVTSDELADAEQDSYDAVDYLLRAKADTDACPGDCKIHCGLFVAYTQFMDKIYPVVKPYMEEGFGLVVTGHSLGGGYSGLAGAELMFQGYNPLVITFAGLKQGNQEYNEFVDDMFQTVAKNESIAAGEAFDYGTYVRVYSEHDIVPRLPPTKVYTNGGLQFELMTSDIPQTKEEIEYNGPSNNAKADNYLTLDGIDSVKIVTNHNSYFVEQGTCS